MLDKLVDQRLFLVCLPQILKIVANLMRMLGILNILLKKGKTVKVSAQKENTKAKISV
jgi:hypothetical protein